MSQKIDFKLLRVVNTLVVSGSVNATAMLLNLSPSAVSYSLKKLRAITGEHLFIRTKTGMIPSSTAYDLSQRYQKYFEADAGMHHTEQHYDQSSLTIQSYSPVELLLSESIARLAHRPDNFRYIFLPHTVDVDERMKNLANETAYIDIGSELPQDNAIGKVKFFTSGISALASIHNKQIPKKITCAQLYQSKHAVWSSVEQYYCEDLSTSLEVKKYIQKRKVAVISASIVNMVELCARSNCIMLLPDFFVPFFTRAFAVKHIELPPELRMKHDCYIHFNNKLTEHAAMMRLLDNILQSAKKNFPCHSP